jgi:tRNA dimethylallyltransferase
MEAPSSDRELRDRLRREIELHGSHALHRRLVRLDPRAARRIHPNDVKRLVRALEVHELTGGPISARQGQFEGRPRLRDRMVGLRCPRAVLYDRVERRVDQMMAAGLLEEVKALRGRLGPQARQALGYKQLLAHLEGQTDLDEAVRLVKRDTRRFAKHQLTWLRRFPQARWVDSAESEDLSEVAERCERALLLAA